MDDRIGKHWLEITQANSRILNRTMQIIHFIERSYGLSKLKLLSHDSFAFPATDLSEISFVQENWRLYFNFLGIFGVDSPYTLSFNHIFNQKQVISQPLREFMGMINQQLFYKYYLVWKYHKFFLYLETYKNIDKLLAKRVASQPELERLLSLNTQLPVHIFMFQTCWLNVTTERIGSRLLLLGRKSLLGMRRFDQHAKILISIKMLNWYQAYEMRCGTYLFDKLVAEIRHNTLLTAELFYDIPMKSLKKPILGKVLQLGWSIALGCNPAQRWSWRFEL